MSGPFWYIWSLASTVLMGLFITAVLLVPDLQRSLTLWIPVACVAGCVAAFPLSSYANKQIQR